MKQIIIFPKGTLDPKIMERATRAGYLAIEADDPSKIVMLSPTANINADDLLIAALDCFSAVSGFEAERARAAFTVRYTNLLKEARKASKP